MKVVYLDPGLGAGKGHNFAMVHEFDQALASERDLDLHHVLQQQASAERLPALKGRVHNTIKIDGYTRLAATEVLDAQRKEALLTSVAADLAQTGVQDADVILMPTVYPLHLLALAQHVPLAPHCRVVLGLLLPCSFWSPDSLTERALAGWMVDSVNLLANKAQLLAYSETGTFRFADNVVPMATLLPPVARPNAALVRDLAARARNASPTDGAPILGFFGSPFGTKGFALLIQTLQAMAQANKQPSMQVQIHLPPGHEAMCAQLRALAPWIMATSADTDNATYLRQMAAVDVVWALYDPHEYNTKMSGIVPEAISLGKPLLLADGCTALQDFLERHAPGSFVLAPYDGSGVEASLGMERTDWLHPLRCAQAHAPLLQEMKSMDRFLAVCGLH